MADDLTEIHERVRWCRNQILFMGAEIELYMLNGAYLVSSEVDVGGRTHLSVQLGKPIPASIRITAGSVAHELRATLDSLACVLAARNGQTADNVYFPVSKSAAIFAADGQKKITKLSVADKATIASLNPYAEGNPMLFALHETDLMRKHRRLVLTSAGVSHFALTGGTIVSPIIKFEGPLTHVKQTIMSYEGGFNMQGNLAIDVSFAEPKFLVGRPLIAVLNDFANLVQAIVELFD
ncbi:hypothetical protein [Mesorhizobium cantuariense]|uniref:Uncharacterized protein n=1 Tax=Mesorhizobium cantuariense TaxID=1300275 RepID=A0ABV7MTI8_9HYPH